MGANKIQTLISTITIIVLLLWLLFTTQRYKEKIVIIDQLKTERSELYEENEILKRALIKCEEDSDLLNISEDNFREQVMLIEENAKLMSIILKLKQENHALMYPDYNK